jgi:hypothetical protein
VAPEAPERLCAQCGGPGDERDQMAAYPAGQNGHDTVWLHRPCVRFWRKEHPVADFRVLADCPPETACVACGRPGAVKRIAATSRPGAKSETLHAACAAAWFAQT